jgi:hypothetical protein
LEYPVRNKDSGHGSGAKPRELPAHYAAYALHLAASNIVFLIQCHQQSKGRNFIRQKSHTVSHMSVKRAGWFDRVGMARTCPNRVLFRLEVAMRMFGLCTLVALACGSEQGTAIPIGPRDGGVTTADTGVDATVTPDTGVTVCTTSAETGIAARITISSAKCTYTLAEARAGIRIDYEVVVDADIPNVVPTGLTSAPMVGPSGLQILEELEGNGQKYCICDSGRGPGLSMTPVTLRKGSYRGTFEWDGHNWGGPSDTGMPKGALFPAGSYMLDVHTAGTKDGVMFTMSGKLPITLVP